MQQDQKIAYFLRSFVRNNCQCGHRTQLEIGHESGGYQNAVNKIVEGITDHNHQATTAIIRVFVMGMALLMLNRMRFVFFAMKVTPQHTFMAKNTKRMRLSMS